MLLRYHFEFALNIVLSAIFRLWNLVLRGSLIPITYLATRRPFKRSLNDPSLPVATKFPDHQVIDLTGKVNTLTADPVAQGGFSDVFCGEIEEQIVYEDGMKRKVKRKVAIKLLRCFMRCQFDFNCAEKRLDREVDLLRRVHHPNVVEIFGTSHHMGGRPALIMPWYCNGDAHTYLQNTDLDASHRLRLIRDIALGLLYLHTLMPPIVHGDLKATNILITDDGRAAICDFGLSQALQNTSSIGNVTTMAASTRWLPPELLLTDKIRPALPSDIWSLACTACEIWVGDVPYSNRQREVMVIQDIVRGVKPFERPSASIVQGDHSLWQLFSCCWNDCPLARPSIVDVSTVIEQICSRWTVQ